MPGTARKHSLDEVTLFWKKKEGLGKMKRAVRKLQVAELSKEVDVSVNVALLLC